MTIRTLTSRVRIKGGKNHDRDDRAKPAAPSLDFAQPEPLSPKPRQDAATDDAHGEVEDVGAAIRKADPQKVADRVYELMQREMADARNRGGAGRKR